MKKYIPLTIIFIVFIPCLSYSQATIDFDIVEKIRGEVEANSNIWIGHIKQAALNLFYILAIISFVGKFILDVMSKGEIDAKDSIGYYLIMELNLLLLLYHHLPLLEKEL